MKYCYTITGLDQLAKDISSFAEIIQVYYAYSLSIYISLAINSANKLRRYFIPEW